MLRAIRRILLLLAVAAISGGILLTFTTKPDLQSSDSAIKATWSTLQPQISERVQALESLNNAMIKAGRRIDLADECAAAVRAWGQKGGSLNERIRQANRLETLGVRLLAIAGNSPRFASSNPVIAAANAYGKSTVDPDDRDRLNTEIDRSNAVRDGLLRRLVADALGYSDHPHLLG
jgi:hypothetical protein